MPLEIRRLAPTRWKEYRRLRLESLKLSPLAFGSSLEEEEGLKANEWKKRMKTTYFAMAGGVPVAMIACAFNNDVKFRHIAEIFSFYVKPEQRGRGIGKALLQHALRLARENERIIKVRLYVNSQQRSAVKMYENAGFAEVGKLEKEMRVGKKFYTMLVMENRITR